MQERRRHVWIISHTDSGYVSPALFIDNSDLSINTITALYAGTFVDLPVLTSIYLMSNRITLIEVGTFVNLPVIDEMYDLVA